MRRFARPTGFAALVVGGIVAPFVLTDYGTQVLMIAYYYVLIGVSWNILAGYTGQFSVAHHALAALGAYASAAAVLMWHVPVFVGLPIGAGVAAVLGFGLGWLTLGMRGVYFAIATWAFAETARLLLAQNYQITRGDNGLPVPFLFDSPSPLPYYYVFLGAAVLYVLINVVLLRLKVGYRMRAIRDDPELAIAHGIDVVKWKRYVFTLTAAMAGFAGALYGHSIGLLTPNMAHFSQMALVIIAVVLGGFRTLWGPVLGAIIVQGLSEVLRFSVEWRLVLFGVIVIAIVRFYPSGLMGLVNLIGDRINRPPRVSEASAITPREPAKEAES